MKKFKRSKSSRKELKSSKKKFFSKQTIWAVGIVLIMVLSVIGFMYVAPSETEHEYGGVTFIPIVTGSGSVDHWVAVVNSSKIIFYNHPYDVGFINMTVETENLLSSSRVFYLTSDVDDTYKEDIALMDFQMTEDLYSAGYIFIPSFTSNNTFDKPIITCSNATTVMPVIYFLSGKNDSITLEDNCIKVEFSSQLSSRRFKDRLMLGILGLEE